jgi:hypothetical protein
MVRYFYAWAPLFFIGTLVVLALPWLGLIALMVVALVALPALGFALVWATVSATHMVMRAAGHFHRRSAASPRTAPALSPGRSQHVYVP